MKHINLTQQNNETDWSKRFVDETDYDELFSEDVFVTKPDGSPLLCLLKNVIPTELNSLAWSALKKFKPITDNRSVATGIDSVARKKLDGTMQKTTRVPLGWEVVSGIIGNFERTVRHPFCKPCAWNEKNPEKFAQIVPLIERVNELFAQHVPERWEMQREFCSRTPKDYLIGNTVFTTITVNKNFRTSCHKDAGDLPEGFSCLSVIKEGHYTGGYLVFPNYRVAADVQMGDLILFDPHEFHGNTMIKKFTTKTQRCSLVYYYREKMQFCLSPAEELHRAKNRKAGDKIFDV